MLCMSQEQKQENLSCCLVSLEDIHRELGDSLEF